MPTSMREGGGGHGRKSKRKRLGRAIDHRQSTETFPMMKFEQTEA